MKRPLASDSDPSPSWAQGRADAAQPHQETETGQAVREAVAAALDRKAEDLKVLHVAEVTHFTDYFLLCSGTNSRQVQAIADGVEERLRNRKVKPLHVEGYQSGQWVLMDYGDFVLHVFLQERRRFYGLERLWGDAPDVTAELVQAAGGDSPPPR
jgi:ribosome-associated protein